MSSQQFATRPITIFRDFNSPMPKSTQPVEGAKGKATWEWQFGVDNNKIFFKVNDGLYGAADKNARNKEVELNFADRNDLLNLLLLAVEQPNFTQAQHIVKKKQWNNQIKRFNDEPTTLCTFTVRKNPKGLITVVYARGTYKVEFAMINPNSEILVKTESGEIERDLRLMSASYVRSFVNFSSKFLDPHEWDNYKAPEKKENQGRSNNYNNNQNNNSNSSSEFDFDEDIAF